MSWRQIQLLLPVVNQQVGCAFLAAPWTPREKIAIHRQSALLLAGLRRRHALCASVGYDALNAAHVEKAPTSGRHVNDFKASIVSAC